MGDDVNRLEIPYRLTYSIDNDIFTFSLFPSQNKNLAKEHSLSGGFIFALLKELYFCTNIYFRNQKGYSHHFGEIAVDHCP